MVLSTRVALLALSLCLLTPALRAAGDSAEMSADAAAGVSEAAPADTVADAAPAEPELQVEPRRGAIDLPGGIAKLDVPDTFFYLSPDDTEKVLVAWGNPPGNRTLGMLVPTATGLAGDGSWAVVITYSNDGHVADDDAAEINYDELLEQMKEGGAEENAARKEAGYPAIDLLGWAEAPHYEAGEHKFYWAKQLRVEGAGGDTLNYSVRVLGREGVLELNAIAAMEQLAQIRADMPKVMAMASFVDGQRYTDFNEATDHMAAYGLAALVAGGVAAKVGLWAKLIALLIAFKKFIIIGVIAVGAWFSQWFSRRKGKDRVEA